MSRFLAAFLLSVPLTLGVALACDGDPNCNKEHCKMPTSTASAAPLPEGPQANLDVTGMKCGACADKVHAALMGVEGVREARIDPAAGKAIVVYDDKKTNLDALVAAVATAGPFEAKLTPKQAEPPATVTQ